VSLLPQLAARVAGLPGGKVVLPPVCCRTLCPCFPSLTAPLLVLMLPLCYANTIVPPHRVTTQITVRFGLPEDELTEEDVEQLRKDGASDAQVHAAPCLRLFLPAAVRRLAPAEPAGSRCGQRRGGLTPSLSCPTHGSTPHLLTSCLVPLCPAPFRSAAGAGGAAVAHRAQPSRPAGRLVPQQRPGGWVALCRCCSDHCVLEVVWLAHW